MAPHDVVVTREKRRESTMCPRVDYGAPRLVLATDNQGRELWWRLPFSTSQWGRREYHPGELILAREGPLNPGAVEAYLHEGGRCTKTLLRRYAEEIDKFFEVEGGLYEVLDPRYTAVLERRKPEDT